MEVAVLAVVVAAVVEKVLQRTYEHHRITILITALCIGVLAIILAVAVYEKVSLFPVLLLFR